MSIQIRNISQSITGLGRGVQAAQGSAKTISSTLKRSIAFKRKSIRISQETFLKRRDAVRRREQESLIEANTLSGATARAGSVAANSTKGFLGRVMDFIGSLLVAWAVKNLPVIVKTITAVIGRIRRVSEQLSLMVQNLGNFFNGLTGVLSAIGQNLLEFDFMDESKRFETAVDYMTNSFDLMKGNIDSAFNILKEPIDYIPLEQAAAGAGEEQVAQEQTQEGGTTTTTAGPSMTYSSQGGQRIVDVGGQDYGDYGPGRIGSRGSARVHGADGKQRGHTGEDYSLPIGKPLTMIAKGTVVDVENDIARGGGYGRFVVVKLDNGMYVKMAHLDKIYVKKGQRVGAGSAGGGRAVVIGTSGNTGLSTGPHLHLDYARSYNPANAMVSQTSNPKNFIEGGGLVIGSNVKSSGQVTTTSAPSVSQSSSSSSGNGRVSPQEVYSYLKSKGLSHNHIMGIIAGIDGESGFRIGVQEQGHTKEGIGLFQYTYPSRKQAFLQAVPNYKQNWKGQVDYAVFHDPETKAYLNRQWSSPEAAAEWWLVQWERPLESLRDGRRTKYRQFIKNFNPGNISSSVSAPNLQLPPGSDSINVPMPAGQSQQQSGSSSSGGGFMGAVNDAGQALNRFITERFLNNL